jgi:hypothetical protein
MEKALSRKGQAVKFRKIIDLPDVVAAHAEAPTSRSKWSGINVAKYRGTVQIFIIRKQQ